jgi:hypothetical protein
MGENRIPTRVLYMNLGTTGLRDRPRNRWQNEVREDARIVGGEGWQESLHSAHASGMNECSETLPCFGVFWIMVCWIKGQMHLHNRGAD